MIDLAGWSFDHPVLFTVAAGGVYFTTKFLYGVIRPLWSPLRSLPGPKNKNIIWGHLQEIFKEDPAEVHLKWAYEYGPTYVYKGFLNRDRVVSLDSKALAYILNHSYDFPKPEELRENLAELLGQGLLFAEGDVHKRQRRVMNPSFARPHIRELTDIFHEKSLQLRDTLNMQLTQSGGVEFIVNICPWLNKVTLDIIGLAGFDYKFDALNPTGKTNELLAAFSNTMKGGGFRLANLIRAYFPLLRKIPTRQRRHLIKSSEVMTRIGFELVETKKQALQAAANNKEGSPIEKSNISGRDLLSRLLAANMATDLPENQRLSDHDVFSQISTFLVAGHETTATAATWALFALAKHPEVQAKLREELLLVETNTPSMDELNALPYLENVVRETMRLHAPVSSTVRVAARDDMIPLETPYQDKNGIMRHEIPISKGDRLFIPILALNVHTSIWGDDSRVFRPERWTEDSEKQRDVPGVYVNMLTFLAGPRACIGFRFALVELKCILFALVRSFQFELAVPAEDITKRSALVTRPFLKGSSKSESPQLPLKVSPWKAT